jgi:RHS repeat-associated protein
MATTTKYIWDDDNLLAGADGTNTINAVYTNEPQQHGNLISSRISGATSYHEFDVFGSTRQLTNGAATVTDVWIYDAWGTLIAHSGLGSTALLWIGQFGYYSDVETGLALVRLRTIGPNIARWLSQDPRPLVSGDPDNRYSYAINNPANFIDPSGAVCVPCLIIVFGLCLVAAGCTTTPQPQPSGPPSAIPIPNPGPRPDPSKPCPSTPWFFRAVSLGQDCPPVAGISQKPDVIAAIFYKNTNQNPAVVTEGKWCIWCVGACSNPNERCSGDVANVPQRPGVASTIPQCKCRPK